jgi:hypothetical protein
LGSQVSGVVETKVWTAADKQPVMALLANFVLLDRASNSAASDKGHTRVLSTRKIVIRRQELGWHFLLRR